MTAGMTSARLGRKTLILTGDVLGGQLISIEKVEGFPGFPDGIPGYDLCPILQDQAGAAGAEFMMSSMEGLESQEGHWRVTTGEGDLQAPAIILATGSALKKLGVPGEERLAGSGVSHCATCDAPLLRDRIVVVVGGGDSAMQEALTLAEFASKVVLLNRGDALTGQACYRDRVRAHAKIDIRFNTVVTEIIGDAAVAGVRAARHQNRCVVRSGRCRALCLCRLTAKHRLSRRSDQPGLGRTHPDRFVDADRAHRCMRSRKRAFVFAVSRRQCRGRWRKRSNRRRSLSGGRLMARWQSPKRARRCARIAARIGDKPFAIVWM